MHLSTANVHVGLCIAAARSWSFLSTSGFCVSHMQTKKVREHTLIKKFVVYGFIRMYEAFVLSLFITKTLYNF